MALPHLWVSQSQLQSIIHIANSCQQSLENLSVPFFNFLLNAARSVLAFAVSLLQLRPA